MAEPFARLGKRQTDRANPAEDLLIRQGKPPWNANQNTASRNVEKRTVNTNPNRSTDRGW